MCHSSGDVARNPLCTLNASVRLGGAYGTVFLSSSISTSPVFAFVSCYSLDSALAMNQYRHQRLRTVIIYSTKKLQKNPSPPKKAIRRHLKQTDELKINIHHNQKIFHLRILKILEKTKCLSITGKFILQVSW